MKTAVHLFDQRLQVSTRKGNIHPSRLRSLLFAVTHLDPFEAVGDREMGFSWISEILNSGYSEEEQYSMANVVVRLVGRCYRFGPFSPNIQSAWIPPLLKFLLLCENLPTAESPPHPGLVALRILSDGTLDADFGPALLPTLVSTLSPDTPLQSRKVALAAFNRFMSGWFSPQMETVSGRRLDKLLQAVGDPFHFPPESSPDQGGELEKTVRYEPMGAVAVLIEFASSELWKSHLHPSNFTSCEDVLSTDEGRGSALNAMFLTALYGWPEFLCTPTKIVTAIRRLEALGCLNTAQVVITWAWITGMVDEMDQDGWRLIGDETFRFYRFHGMRFLDSLKRRIIQNAPKGTMRRIQAHFYARRYEGPPFRVGRSRRPSQLSRTGLAYEEEWDIDRVISQACLLRRLYHLFGYDPMTWQETVGVGEADEEREALPEHPVTPDPFIDWECDYP